MANFRWVVCVISVSLAVTSCAHFKKNYLEKPDIEVIGAEIEDISNSDARVLVIVKVTNPNKVDIDLDKLSYQIFLNDGTTADTHEVSNVLVPKQGSKDVALPLKINFKDVIKAIGNLVQQKDVSYKIKGRADVGLLKIPFEKAGTIDVKRD